MRDKTYLRIAVVTLSLAGLLCGSACGEGKPSTSSLAEGIAALHEGRPGDAASILRRAVSQEPANGAAYFHLGVANFRLSRWKDAAASLEQACKLLEDDPVALQFLGQSYMRLGRWTDAERVLRDAIRVHPGNSRALTTLGVVCVKLNRVRDAEAFFGQALDADAEYPAALYNMAFLKYKWLAKPTEAVELFEKFIRVSDDSPRITLARDAVTKITAARRKTASAPSRPTVSPQPQRTAGQGASPAQTEQSAPSSQAISRSAPAVAKSENPAAQTVPVARGRDSAVEETRQGIESFKAKSAVKAVEHFKRAVADDASYDVAQYNLGLAYEAQGRTQDAIKSFREALRLKPGKSEAAYALANAYWKSGNADAATSVLGKLISTDPGHAKAYFLLGFISEKTPGGRDITRRHYQSYLRLQKTGTHADYARKWLSGATDSGTER